MRTRKLLIAASICIGLFGLSTQSLAVSSVSDPQPSVQQTVKKTVTVPKPKTNWSKIKELFM